MSFFISGALRPLLPCALHILFGGMGFFCSHCWVRLRGLWNRKVSWGFTAFWASVHVCCSPPLPSTRQSILFRVCAQPFLLYLFLPSPYSLLSFLVFFFLSLHLCLLPNSFFFPFLSCPCPFTSIPTFQAWVLPQPSDFSERI